MTDNKEPITNEEALAYHAEGQPGKLSILPTKPLMTQRDLSLGYSPGVAVPCIKRNMLGASAACAASDASISGVESFIPFDEVVMAMRNIAKIMSPKLRETALGGLAVTPTGLMIRKKLGLPPLKPNEID